MFPLPKNTHIAGTVEFKYCYNFYSYIISSFKINKPKFIPEGYSNLKLDMCGHYRVDNGKDIYSYIDTTILSVDDYNFFSDGRYEIRKEDIPEPFWVLNIECTHNGFWKLGADINKMVKEHDKNAELITEEELASIFALNFSEKALLHINDDMKEEFIKKRPDVLLNVCWFGYDNWSIAVRSKENRNVNRLMYLDSFRSGANFYYENDSFYYNSDEYKPFDVYPVLHEDNYSDLKYVKKLTK